jgi:hypothetical protein
LWKCALIFPRKLSERVLFPTKKEPVMKNGVSYLALGVGLLTGTLFAYGQTPSPTAVAQAVATVPPSGVLVTQPPAPVAVPPSGVLVTQPMIERRSVATVPVKTAQTVRTAERATPVAMRRHVRHRRTTATTVAAAQDRRLGVHGDVEQNAGKGKTPDNGPLPGEVETSFPGLNVSAIQWGKLKLPRREEQLPQE